MNPRQLVLAQVFLKLAFVHQEKVLIPTGRVREKIVYRLLKFSGTVFKRLSSSVMLSRCFFCIGITRGSEGAAHSW